MCTKTTEKLTSKCVRKDVRKLDCEQMGWAFVQCPYPILGPTDPIRAELAKGELDAVEFL